MNPIVRSRGFARKTRGEFSMPFIGSSIPSGARFSDGCAVPIEPVRPSAQNVTKIDQPSTNMKFKTDPRVAAILIGGLLATQAFAAVTVSPIFRSNMVLQRGVPVPVFGTGDPGATVTVQFQNQTVSAVVDGTGKWRANLASMAASA